MPGFPLVDGLDASRVDEPFVMWPRLRVVRTVVVGGEIEMSEKAQNVVAAMGGVMLMAMVAATYALTSGAVTSKIVAMNKAPVVVAQTDQPVKQN